MSWLTKLYRVAFPAPAPLALSALQGWPSPAVGRPSKVLKQCLALVNEARPKDRQLSLDNRLAFDAQRRAEELAVGGVTHGQGLAGRLRALGYRPRACGRVVAKGQRRSSAVMAHWLGTVYGRGVLLGEVFTQAGFGAAQDGAGVTHWCAVLAREGKARRVEIYTPPLMDEEKPCTPSSAPS